MQCYASALWSFSMTFTTSIRFSRLFTNRDAVITTYEISKDDLYRWADEVLKPTADLAFAGDGTSLCGEWCGFCKAKNERA